jgi:hypothetical protein
MQENNNEIQFIPESQSSANATPRRNANQLFEDGESRASPEIQIIEPESPIRLIIKFKEEAQQTVEALFPQQHFQEISFNKINLVILKPKPDDVWNQISKLRNVDGVVSLIANFGSA